MIKTQLYAKLTNYNFANLFKRKGYVYFTDGDYNLNIIGIRSNNNNVVTNEFDDFIVVTYKLPNGNWTKMIFSATTEPGITYMHNPMNGKGTAILPEGQYRGCFRVGLHKGKYKALVQYKPIKVYRDNNRDDKYDLDPSTFDKGMFGINIHKAGIASKRVDNWSAGCQVIATDAEFKSFMSLVSKSAAKYGDKFTYTLINEKDL